MKKTILLTFLFGIIADAAAQTYTLTDDDVVVEEGVIRSCSYNFEIKDIIIPEILDGQTVTGTYDGYWTSSGVFSTKGITSVELPPTLERIGEYTFYGNKLASLDLTGLTALHTIAYKAFDNNELTGIDFSGCTALSIISDEAFYRNDLTSLDITGCSALVFMGEKAFGSNPIAGGFHLPEVDYEGTLYQIWDDETGVSYTAGTDQATNLNTTYVARIPYTLTDDNVEVENGILKRCSYGFELKNIVIPETLDGQTVIEIGSYAFEDSRDEKGIISIEFPGSLQTIGQSAMHHNEILHLDFSNCPGLTSIGNGAFYGNKGLSIDLSANDQLSSIGDNTFYENNFTTLDLSACEVLTTIGEGAFYGNHITALDITGCTALTTISDEAFYGNDLNSLDITSCTALTYIGEKAFGSNDISGGFHLPEVNYEGNVYQLWDDRNGDSYLAGTDKATDLNTSYAIRIPYTLTDDDVEVVEGFIQSCSYDFELKNIIIPEILDGQSVIGIGGYAFGSQGITSIEIPKTIQTIENFALDNNGISALDFSDCSDLTTIGSQAFMGNRISSINFSGCSSLTNIRDEAFSDNNLNSLDITGCTALTYIGLKAFYSNNLSEGFHLPEVDCSGEICNTWDDGEGNSYTSGTDKATDFFSLYYLSPPDGPVDIYGDVFGTWKSGKTYRLKVSYIEVVENKALIIEEGVTVIADSDENVLIRCKDESEIKANGTAGKPILFTSSSETPGSWRGIEIYGTDDNSMLDHVIIEYATTALSLRAWAIGCDAVSIYSEISHCIIRNNSRDGIYCKGSGSSTSFCTPFPKTGFCIPVIKNCQIYDNGQDGIEMASYGTISRGYVGTHIINNLIYNNTNGIYSYGNDQLEPAIINNVIIDNSETGIKSTHPSFRKDNYLVANNILANNGTGIINEDTSAINLTANNLWENGTNLEGVFDEVLSIYENPLLTDQENHDYTLTPLSPLIDAGSNDYVNFDRDFNGRIRIWDGNQDHEAIVDIGAYELGAPCAASYVSVSVCQGESYNNHTETGIYYDTLTTVSGCDSIVTVDLTVNPASSTYLDETICHGETFTIGEQIFSESGNHTVTLLNQFGCDSIVDLSLQVNPLPVVQLGKDTTITENQAIQIDAGEGFVSYDWNTGDQNQVLQVSGLGEGNYEYSVTVTDANGCSNSDTLIVSVTVPVSISNLIENGSISVFPNPVDDKIYLQSDRDIDSRLTISIYDHAGILLKEEVLTGFSENQRYTIDIPELNSGMYLLKFRNAESTVIRKVVKE